MRKQQMVKCFQLLDEIESAEDPAQPIQDLRNHLEGVRKGWWADSTRAFTTLSRTLDAFYRESWNPEFKFTEKRRKARNRYANLILDQIRQSWRD